MKVAPVASPHAIQPPVSSAVDKRAAAVNAFKTGQSSFDRPQAQEYAVANPNNISPEEISAVRPNAVPTPQEPQGEAQTETLPQATEDTRDPALRRQFAQLAKQERQLRQQFAQQKAELEKQKSLFEQEKKSWSTKEEDYGKNYFSKDGLKSNTLQALAEAGISYDDLTQQILNQAPPNPQMEATVKALRQEIQDLRKGQDEAKSERQQAQQEQRQAAERQILVDATDLIRSNPIAYEAINALGKRGIHEVRKLITETYDKDGVLMSVEQAADEVENYLVEENFNMSSKISKIKKRLQGNDTQGKTAENQQTQSVSSPAPMKTMTNATASSRRLSAKERAIKAFKGENF